MTNENNVIKARVGLFSGQENPEITVDGGNQKHFVQLVQAVLGGDHSHPLGPPKLGTFYGFLVSIPPKLADELSLPENIEVREGVVSILMRKEIKYWRDIAGLGDFLIGIAFDQGHGKNLRMLGIKHEQKD